jgi:hypothetical protein
MDDRKGKSSILWALWALLPPYLSRDDRNRYDELSRFRHNLLRYIKDNDLRNLRDNDLHNLRDNIFHCFRNDDLPYGDDELRNLIAYEIAKEKSRLKNADDLYSAFLSAKKKAGRDKRHVVLPPGSKLLTIASSSIQRKLTPCVLSQLWLTCSGNILRLSTKSVFGRRDGCTGCTFGSFSAPWG